MGAFVGATVRDGPRRRRDRRALLRGVGAAPAAGRLHDPAPLADPRRARPGDAASATFGDVRDRGARAQLHVRRAPSCAAGAWWSRGAARCARRSASACACRSSRRRRCAAASCSSTARSSTTCRSALMADLGEGPIIAVDVKAVVRARGAEAAIRAAARRAATAEPRRDAHAGAAARQREHVRGGAPARRPRDQPPSAEGVGLLEFHQLDVRARPGAPRPARHSRTGRRRCSGKPLVRAGGRRLRQRRRLRHRRRDRRRRAPAGFTASTVSAPYQAAVACLR